MPDESTIRADFEAWAKTDEHFTLDRWPDSFSGAPGQYVCRWTQRAYRAYRAAALRYAALEWERAENAGTENNK